MSDVRPRENFSRHVEQEREEPLAISVENFFPRDENFVLKARVGIRRDVEGVQIIGLLAREMFFKNFHDEGFEVVAAQNFLQTRRRHAR